MNNFNSVNRVVKNNVIRAFVILTAVACSSDATAPLPVEGMAFSYSGAVSGTFAASGQPDTTGTRPWAMAHRVPGASLMFLAAVRPRSATTHDVVAIIVPRVTPGMAKIENVCPPEGCADLLATFGRQNGGSDFLQGCHITSGTVTIMTITDQRVTGTFQGTGSCFNNEDGESTFEVTAGSFDLSLTVDLPGAALSRSPR
jgi:hypothetical protein